ncbi:MAG: glucose-1-phosphate adenylyltransferase family protein [Bacteroidota bacterium]
MGDDTPAETRFRPDRRRRRVSVLTLVLAGGSGSRLSVLCENRVKPAVPFAGKYRIIDFALSNAVNSDLYRVALLTQHRPHSLMQHIGMGEPWDLNRRWPNGIQMWQPFRGRSEQEWQRGTADALYQNRDFIAESGCEQLLILSGDHIFKQDFRDLLRFHEARSADITVGAMFVPPEEVHRFGIMSVGTDRRITQFTEKPEHSSGGSALASMGIYVFNTHILLRRLAQDAADVDSSHDFGSDIVPRMVQQDRAFAYPFNGYWVDVGTIEAYWATNLALLAEDPALDLYDRNWVFHTRSEERPPVRLGPAGASHHSLVSNGCIIHGTVINSVLSPGVFIERGAVVRDSVVMNDTTIRAGAVIDRCILDKEVEIGTDAQLGAGVDNTPNQLEPENLATGITLIGKRARVPSGAIVGRNCCIHTDTTPEDFPGLQVPTGATITRQESAG